MGELRVIPDVDSRLLSQLGTYPPGQGRTAADIAASMVGMEARDVEKHLARLASQRLVVREPQASPRLPDLWRKWL
jgi:hypothetical protein